MKNWTFIGFVTIFQVMCHAQSYNNNSKFFERVRYGGSLGMGFFNGGLNVNVSPSAIYPVTNEFSAGASLNFNYAKFNDEKLLAYGGSILSLYNPIPQIQLSAEFEQLRINRSLEAVPYTLEDNYWLPALFLGVGYSTYNVTFGLRYDLLYNDNKSIYGNALMPFVRVYF